MLTAFARNRSLRVRPRRRKRRTERRVLSMRSRSGECYAERRNSARRGVSSVRVSRNEPAGP